MEKMRKEIFKFVQELFDKEEQPLKVVAALTAEVTGAIGSALDEEEFLNLELPAKDLTFKAIEATDTPFQATTALAIATCVSAMALYTATSSDSKDVLHKAMEHYGITEEDLRLPQEEFQKLLQEKKQLLKAKQVLH
jgi:hypothetical protein